MAKVGCLCGTRLSDVNCPSDDIIYIYYQEEIDSILNNNSNISLWDYYESSFSKHLHWHCKNCGRIYKFPNGAEVSPVVIYVRMEQNDDICVDKLEQIYILSDVEIDTITEEMPDIKLQEFLNSRDVKELYFYKKEENTIYVLDNETGKLMAKYVKEQ